MMRKKLAALGLILLVIAAACGNNDEADSSQLDSVDRENSGAPAPPPLDLPEVDAIDQPVSQPAAISNQERLIIQNAILNLMVEDVTAKVADIRAIATQHNGWIVGSNTSSRIAYDDVSYGYGSIAIRVPADRFDDALAAIKVIGVIQVNSENITGEDVTERYVDLNSRLRSK